MEMNEIKKMNDEDLGLESARVRRALFNLKSQVVTEKVKDSSQFGKMRVDLARLLTEQTSRRLAKNPPASKGTVSQAPDVRKATVNKPSPKKSAPKKVAGKKVMS